MIHYGRAPFLDLFPSSRVPSYPRHKGPLTSEVVIVGGGLTGCATAYAFAAAGIPVTLVEADRIGRGSTGALAGWISEDPGASFIEVEKMIGLRAARHAFHAWRRAALDFSALLRRLDIACRLEPHSALTVALTPEQAARLKREQKARLDAGLEAPALNARAITAEVALGAAFGLRAATARRSIRIVRASAWRRRRPSAAHGSSSARP